MKARARKEAPRNPAASEAKVIDMLAWLRQRLKDRWIQARSLMHEQQGPLDPEGALRLAYQDWAEQERLEREFKAGR